MAWTSPKTFVAGRSLTASELNTFLRDNMLETAAGRATPAGWKYYFIVDTPNRLVARRYVSNWVVSNESTDKNEFTDLPTNEGPTCTLTTGTTATVFLSAQMQNEAGSTACEMGFEVRRSTNAEEGEADEAYIPADKHRVLRTIVNAAMEPQQFSNFIVVNNLIPGVNTFQAKYRSGFPGNVAWFHARRMVVLPRD